MKKPALFNSGKNSATFFNGINTNFYGYIIDEFEGKRASGITACTNS
ncbi:hypothetical protein [Chryseobacterium taklimakanense]|nr:hypothetical protein [Chryseobacterium taklimakanense]